MKKRTRFTVSAIPARPPCGNSSYTEEKRYINEKKPLRLPAHAEKQCDQASIIIPLPPAGRTRVYQGRLHQGTGRHHRLYSRHHRRMQRSASGLRLLLFLQLRIHDRCINIFLPEYKDYHKTAAEGGRGYITMSKRHAA